MRLLVVLGLVALLMALLYRRLRPYVRFTRDFLKTLRHFQQISANRAGPRDAGQQAEKLVRCEACSTWIPAGRALAGPSGDVFCSQDCLNRRKVEKPRTTEIHS